MKTFYTLLQEELHRFPPKFGIDKAIQRNKLIDEIALLVFKHDSQGNIIVNDKGSPRIDWLRTMVNLVNILAKLFVLYLVNRR